MASTALDTIDFVVDEPDGAEDMTRVAQHQTVESVLSTQGLEVHHIKGIPHANLEQALDFMVAYRGSNEALSAYKKLLIGDYPVTEVQKSELGKTSRRSSGDTRKEWFELQHHDNGTAHVISGAKHALLESGALYCMLRPLKNGEVAKYERQAPYFASISASPGALILLRDPLQMAVISSQVFLPRGVAPERPYGGDTVVQEAYRPSAVNRVLSTIGLGKFAR